MPTNAPGQFPFKTLPDAVTFAPAPLASHTILAGAPMARSAVLAASRDGVSYTMAWDCTAGRFSWTYDVDEIVHIVSGGVRVAFAGEPEVELAAGDVAFFRAGTTAVWTVDSYVRKVAFCQRLLPAPASLVAKAVWKARALVQAAQKQTWLRPVDGTSRGLLVPE